MERGIRFREEKLRMKLREGNKNDKKLPDYPTNLENQHVQKQLINMHHIHGLSVAATTNQREC